jgi:hypothetical protein
MVVGSQSTESASQDALRGNLGRNDRPHFKSESSTVAIATPPAISFGIVAVLAVTARGFKLGHDESVLAQFIKRLRGRLRDHAVMLVQLDPHQKELHHFSLG